MPAGADPSIGDLNEQILALKVELTVVEDWHGTDERWKKRDDAIRARIKELERLRDLLPEQR